MTSQEIEPARTVLEVLSDKLTYNLIPGRANFNKDVKEKKETNFAVDPRFGKHQAQLPCLFLPHMTPLSYW